MLRSYILSVIGLGAFFMSRAQAVQQVVGAGGGSKVVGGYTIDFTVGETVILTAGTDPSCTQGFQQPLGARDFPDSNIGTAGWYIKVYPNPVEDRLTIHGFMEGAGEMDLQVIDLSGRVLLVRPLFFLQGYNDASLDLMSLSRGVYILRITDRIHGGRQVFKLLKK